MPAAVNAQISWAAQIQELYPAADQPSIGALSIAYQANNTIDKLNGASTPPVSKIYSEILTGSQALDLTALARSFGAALNLTGLKLQFLRLINLSATNYVEIADTGANAYPINNGEPVRWLAGDKKQFQWTDALADVGSGAKILSFTATAAQTYHLLMLFG